MIYDYLITATANDKVADDSLKLAIEQSSITIQINAVSTDPTKVNCHFATSISAGEETTLDGLIAAHDGVKLKYTDEVDVKESPSFSSKTLPNGKKLYRRVHGVKLTLDGDTDFDLVVPYDLCKITGIEIVWAPECIQADLKVYDTPTGTISTVANYMLNQFGFNTGIAKDYYSESSQYDADLIKDMKLKATLKNPLSSTKDVCVNFILHEVV